jgi:agmatine/peptidylarginine deiminase
MQWADCIQTVLNGAVCGNIIYESKRTKRFDKKWIDKLRQDQQRVNAGAAVLVTEVLPDEAVNDFTGHVDGLVRFVNEETVVINNLKKELSDAQLLKGKYKGQNNPYRGKLILNWYYSFMSTLLNANLKIIEIPYAVHEAENDTSARGIYLNFLNLKDRILMPWFEDEKF